jgi:hypothetical protein
LLNANKVFSIFQTMQIASLRPRKHAGRRQRIRTLEQGQQGGEAGANPVDSFINEQLTFERQYTKVA